MSESRRKTSGDDLSTLDSRGTLSGKTSLKAVKEPSKVGNFFRTVRNLAILGAFTYGGYEAGNYNAGVSKEEAVVAKADLTEVQVQLNLAKEQIKEAVANYDVKAARSLYAKAILKAVANKPKEYPYNVVRGVFDSIRKESRVPTYVMNPLEREIDIIANHIARLTPNNAGSNFIAVIANYPSMTVSLNSSSTTEQVTQAILDLRGKIPEAQPVAGNRNAKPRVAGRGRNQ